MQEVTAFLRDTILIEYLSTIPSRWAGLLPRLARATQTVQREEAHLSSSTETDVHDLLASAEHLLEQDHHIYASGVRLAAKCQPGQISAGATFDTLLQSMLTELCARECIVAHWREEAAQLSADQLRIYTHALLVRRVNESDVRRLLAQLGDTTTTYGDNNQRL